MFIIILCVVILSGLFTAIKFPNLMTRFKSKLRLPQFKYSKLFKNPKLKTLLQDREYFNQNAPKILSGPLFVVLGKENYKIYDLLVTPDSFGVKKNFQASEEAFEVLEYNDAKFLFINPILSKQDPKNKIFNPRMRLLVERICKYRRQKYIDGVIIFPHSETYKKSEALPSPELANEISFCKDSFQKFADFFRVRVPLYFIAHDVEPNDEWVTKNIFKHDPITLNDDLYLGFSCHFAKKTEKQSFFDYFQTSLTSFIQAFNIKTESILQNSSLFSNGIESVHTLYRVQIENYYLSKNYLSYFLKYFDSNNSIEFSHITILNSVLFASFDGSTPSESLVNIARYLSVSGTNKIVFSDRFLNQRRRINIMLSIWTLLFAGAGSVTLWRLYDYLLEKRMNYIRTSVVEYQAFAKTFNQTLSQKFPFASPQTLQNADYPSIVTILQQFQTLLKSRSAYFYDHIDSLTNRADIQKFTSDLRAISSFFNITNDPNIPPPTLYTTFVKFDYRVHSEKEFLANRIVNWTLTVADQNYGSKYGEQKQVIFPWTYSNLLSFKLDFFDKKDLSYDPALVPQPQNLRSSQIQSNFNMNVQGNAVFFAYLHDDWSLLKFYENHKVCQDSNIPCAEGLLQFTIPLMNQSNVVFFCNMKLLDANGKQLSVPTFPTVAPLFGIEPNY